jgi:hypothetical protein
VRTPPMPRSTSARRGLAVVGERADRGAFAVVRLSR